MVVFNNPNIQRLARVFRTEGETKPSGKAPGPPKPSQGDSVNLSSEAKVLAAIKQRLAETPDVREEKVAALKDAISRGMYHVGAEEIAESILNEGKLL